MNGGCTRQFKDFHTKICFSQKIIFHKKKKNVGIIFWENKLFLVNKQISKQKITPPKKKMPSSKGVNDHQYLDIFSRYFVWWPNIL